MKRLVLGIAMLLASIFVWSQTAEQQLLLATQPSIWHNSNLTNNIAHLRWPAAGLQLAGETPLEKVQEFLHLYGPAFGLKTATSHFRIQKEITDVSGRTHLKLQHYHNGIPVFDGHLNFHFNQQLALVGVDGVVLKNIGYPQALINEAEAASQAMSWLQKQYPGRSLNDVLVIRQELQWFSEGLTEGLSGQTKLVYYLELTNKQDIREYVFVDAKKAQLIAHYPGICDLAQRRLFTGSTNNPIWQEGEELPADLTNWQRTQLHTSEEVYSLFKNTFEWRSFDNLNGNMLLVDQATFLSCPNANWNGYSANFCNNTSSDDVVAHEWGHAYTEYTSNLIFAWQAGAINEAFSDIWGETIDLLNSPEAENLPRTDCSSSPRWKIAEEATAFDEPIRDMWSPDCHGHPGKTSDITYSCSEADYGGVHHNSGVVAHTYALLADGGTYNGYTINGIGLTKAAHLFWHVQAHYLSRTSNFRVLAAALSSAYLDLAGSELPELKIDGSEPLEYEILDRADSLALQQAIAATELQFSPDCAGFSSILQPGFPDFCLQNGEVFTPFYFEDFETGTNSWTFSAHPTDPLSWASRHWSITDELPENRVGKAAFGASPNIGHCDTLINSGTIRLKTPAIDIPTDIEGNIYLTFEHYFSLEDGMDGGNLKVQQNGGNWLKIPPIAFLHNGYNYLIPANAHINNPLAGERVFTGADIGSVSGSWGTSQINLSILGIEAGESIRLRWELGTDGCNGWDGWYIDNVQVGTCAALALPVEWLSFTATAAKQAVQLSWRTTNEQDNLGFHIERSTDGAFFKTIGFVAAKHSTNATIDYEYQDKDTPPLASYLYYRLRQEDHSGKTSYSVIRQLRQQQNIHVSVHPNPATNQVTLSLPSVPFATAGVQLYDLHGQMIKSFPEWETSSAITLAVGELPAGIYLLHVIAGNDLYTQRLVVQ